MGFLQLFFGVNFEQFPTSIFSQFGDFFQTPHMVTDSRLHCWRHAQGLVNPAEIVIHKMQGERQLVISQFLGKSICQSGESSVAHSQRKVLALDITG
jgi:hypothetical protein